MAASLPSATLYPLPFISRSLPPPFPLTPPFSFAGAKWLQKAGRKLGERRCPRPSASSLPSVPPSVDSSQPRAGGRWRGGRWQGRAGGAGRPHRTASHPPPAKLAAPGQGRPAFPQQQAGCRRAPRGASQAQQRAGRAGCRADEHGWGEESGSPRRHSAAAGTRSKRLLLQTGWSPTKVLHSRRRAEWKEGFSRCWGLVNSLEDQVLLSGSKKAGTLEVSDTAQSKAVKWRDTCLFQRVGREVINPVWKWSLVAGARKFGFYLHRKSWDEQRWRGVPLWWMPKQIYLFLTRHQTDLTNTKIYLSHVC